MGFRLENLGILFGLLALAVPILLHLLQRRRFDTLDWGAMQFLPDSVATQHKRWLDELLLMLMRMAMIALIVIALATPISTSAWLAPLGDRTRREVVVVIDGSYSMDVQVSGQPTPWTEAIRWFRENLDPEMSGDPVTVVIAREPPLVWQDASFDRLAAHTPRGNPDMPRALSEAWKHLHRSKAATKEIIVLADRQLHGWADPTTLSALESLGNQWHADVQQAKSDGNAIPSLRVVKVGADLPKLLPNYSLAPLTASRNVVKPGQSVTFQSALHLDGFEKYLPPRKVKVLIDGKPIKSLPLPAAVELKQGQIPLSFSHQFAQEGQHLISLIVEADDAMAADNEQHTVVEVVRELPILLVDGDKKVTGESSSFFLQRALSSKQAIPYSELKASAFQRDGVKPAVVVLADVPRLDDGQIAAIDRFLAEGGGLLIFAGERVARERAFYNEQLYRQGDGWLPAKLGETGAFKDGMQPEPRTFQHPALDLFRSSPDGSMNQVRFPKWCKIALGPKDRATAIGSLGNGDPLFVEKSYKQGRVILCTIPPDRRWGSTLPNAWEFPILAHELAYYLAGSRTHSNTLRHGAPIRFFSTPDSPVDRITLRTPEADAQTVEIKNWPWIYDTTGAVGVYRLEGSVGRAWSFIVPPDLSESNLARGTDDDWRKVRERLPIVWQTETQSIATDDARREELWWLLLAAVLALLCSEVWMTRRMALARGR